MNTPEKLRRVDELTDDNVRRVFDVVLDIHEQLNLATAATVTIPAAPQAVKFGLLQDRTRPSLDEYEEGRKKACAFLKGVGAIADCRTLNSDGQRVWRKLEVKVNRELFDKVLTMLESRRSEQAQHKASSATRPEYDAVNNVLRYGDKTLRIKNNSIQHFICMLTFKKFGAKVAELHILDAVDEARGNYDTDHRSRVVSDSRRELNKKAEKMFGLHDLFLYDSAEVWINTTLFTDE